MLPIVLATAVLGMAIASDTEDDSEPDHDDPYGDRYDAKRQLAKVVEWIRGTPLEAWPFRVVRTPPLLRAFGYPDALAVLFEGRPDRDPNPTWEFRPEQEDEDSAVWAPWFLGSGSDPSLEASGPLRDQLERLGIFLVGSLGSLHWFDMLDEAVGQGIEAREIPDGEWIPLDDPTAPNSLWYTRWIVDALSRGYSLAVVFDDFDSGYFRTYFVHPIPGGHGVDDEEWRNAEALRVKSRWSWLPLQTVGSVMES